jgi:hypothetical protein
MVLYEVNKVPEDHKTIREIGRRVSDTILNRRVPQPSDISKVLGEDAVRAYYLTHALMHSLEHGRERGV